MTRQRTLITLLSGILAAVAFQFHYLWIRRYGSDFLAHNAYGTWLRPYVFRVLLPLLSRILEYLTGIHAADWLIVLFVASAVGLFFAVRYLYETFQRDSSYTNMVSFLICLAMFGLIFQHGQYYDLATAMFFALAFAWLVRGKLIAYLVLFPVATLNRETTFLLTIAFLALSFQRFRFAIPRYIFYSVVYQALVWLLIRGITISVFADNPGAPFLWRPQENLKTYISMPVQAVFLSAGFAWLLYAVFAKWEQQPMLLRTIFLAIFPLQFLLHMTMGYPWEIRVYAESFPILGLLVVPVLRSIFQPAFILKLEPAHRTIVEDRKERYRKTSR